MLLQCILVAKIFTNLESPYCKFPCSVRINNILYDQANLPNQTKRGQKTEAPLTYSQSDRHRCTPQLVHTHTHTCINHTYIGVHLSRCTYTHIYTNPFSSICTLLHIGWDDLEKTRWLGLAVGIRNRNLGNASSGRGRKIKSMAKMTSVKTDH